MDRGILIYGYDKKDATIIKKELSTILDESFILKSAIGRESEKIKHIIEESFENKLDDKKTKVVMFFNIDNFVIQSFLNSFPSEIPRPIFCALTEHNINWSFNSLLDHLLEEQAHWQNQNKKP